jgi:hypothetical protein
MPESLVIFGYESPDEWMINRDQGADFESSNSVWVVAPDEDSALRAGRSYAEGYVQSLFRERGIEPLPSWSDSGFAHWIEDGPLQRFSKRDLETTRAGESRLALIVSVHFNLPASTCGTLGSTGATK